MIFLTKNHQKMAWADRIDLATTLKAPDLIPFELGLWYFNTVTLIPAIAFEHIAGAALIAFLDRCTMESDEIGLQIHNLRYVHGSSEVMKGRPDITSILLARQESEDGASIEDTKWVTLLPEIWHRFQLHRANRNI